jgi:FAD:protein FMN transferase
MVRCMRWNRATATVFLVALASLAAAQTTSQAQPIHRQKYVMGTVFEIVAYDNATHSVSEAIDEAFREIVRLDGVMSNYKEDSELSRLNRSAHFHPQSVSRDLYTILEQALQYSILSDGKFDISVGPLVDLWKAQARGEHSVTADEEQKARHCVGYKKITLLPPQAVEFRSSCLRIDLGAIGKGYAVDRAADVLRARRIERALINAGGSTVYAIGAPPGEAGWTVQLRDPSQHAAPKVLLRDNSVSTSEQTRPSLLAQKSGGHIIDAVAGEPAGSNFGVSVVAKTATASDALSTTLLLTGPEQGRLLLREIPGTAAVWISADGRVESASAGAKILLGVRSDQVAAKPEAPAGVR